MNDLLTSIKMIFPGECCALIASFSTALGLRRPLQDVVSMNRRFLEQLLAEGFATVQLAALLDDPDCRIQQREGGCFFAHGYPPKKAEFCGFGRRPRTTC